MISQSRKDRQGNLCGYISVSYEKYLAQYAEGDLEVL